MKICPKCKRCYSNRFEECSNCSSKLEELKKEDISKTAKSTGMKVPVKNIPTCPICGSTDLKKLSSIDRGASAFMFGLGSNKIGKTYECKNCKATF